MPPPKLHLNEHLSPRLAVQLRQYGFDVTSTLELGMVEADDDEQLAYAASQQRARRKMQGNKCVGMLVLVV
ncbi:MAG: DUF5615 family PIN-like protein [Chloroflexota bacterium]